MKEHKIAVIGAGPCGLAACKALAEYGLDYECLEAGEELGGIWNVERGGGGYRSLHTNTSINGMSYADFPFEKDSPNYASAAQMVRYFARYADHFQLLNKISFRSRVVRALPQADVGWSLELASGEIREYSSLIVATGQYSSPRVPHDSTPGEFAGKHLHIADYLDVVTPLDLRNKRVLVVGLGSSAAELAAELCNNITARDGLTQVVLSARSGRWVLSKMVDGKPLDARSPHPSVRLPAVLRMLPGNVGQWLARRVMGKFIRGQVASLGGVEALGLPSPQIEPWEDRPTMSLDFIPALKAGKIDVRPGIERFEGSTVHFTDGTSTEADVIIYATGYKLHFPFLDEEILGCKAANLALYQRISHPDHNSLFFVGCCRVMCSMWPLAEQQSRWIACQLSGGFDLPSSAERRKKAAPLAGSLPVICNFYVEELRKQSRGFVKPNASSGDAQLRGQPNYGDSLLNYVAKRPLSHIIK